MSKLQLQVTARVYFTNIMKKKSQNEKAYTRDPIYIEFKIRQQNSFS